MQWLHFKILAFIVWGSDIHVATIHECVDVPTSGNLENETLAQSVVDDKIGWFDGL